MMDMIAQPYWWVNLINANLEKQCWAYKYVSFVFYTNPWDQDILSRGALGIKWYTAR